MPNQKHFYTSSLFPAVDLAESFLARLLSKLDNQLSGLLVDGDGQPDDGLTKLRNQIINNETPNGKSWLHLIETICQWINSCHNPRSLVALLPYVSLCQRVSSLISNIFSFLSWLFVITIL